MIMKLNARKGVKLYAGTLFASYWGKFLREDSASTYSRNGYMIKNATFPIL